jgi:hypothetical protein
VKKLAIVGSHPETRHLVPWDDENYDIWTINEAATMKDSWVKRCTGIFQLHPRSIWDNPNNKNDPKHGEWLKANKTATVFMLEKYPDVPMAEKYPLDEITKKYLSNLEVTGTSTRKTNKFYTCTVAYMCALALWKGYKEVDIYGAELSVDSEYRFQRPGAAFWLGLLTQHAKVRFFGRMLDAPIYGYESEGEIDKAYLQMRLELVAPKRAEGSKLIGPLHDEVVRTLQRFEETGVEYEEAIKAWQKFTAHLNAYGIVEGAGQELENRIKEIDKMMELDKDYRFSHHGFTRTLEAIQVERNKVAFRHAYLSGTIDAIYTDAVNDRLQDSKRRKHIAKMKQVIPEYVQLCQKIGIFTGAAAENQHLAGVIQEQRDGSSE